MSKQRERKRERERRRERERERERKWKKSLTRKKGEIEFQQKRQKLRTNSQI